MLIVQELANQLSDETLSKATQQHERRRQSATERKPAILKAFYEVIETEGFENASVAKVAAKAGVHPSLVIHYFGTKERMVLALVDEVLATYGALFRRLPESGPPRERLERLLELVWSREWHEAASLAVVFSFLSLSQRDPAVMAQVRNLYHRFHRYLLEQVRFFVESGVIAVDDEGAAVEALISLAEGSHYFCPFHVEEGAFDHHRRNMIKAARNILGVRYTS